MKSISARRAIAKGMLEDAKKLWQSNKDESAIALVESFFKLPRRDAIGLILKEVTKCS